MENRSLREKIQNIPVPLLPAMVGAATLSNVFAGMGYSFVRHTTMLLATIILFFYTIKIVTYFDTCKKEYSNVIPASLYAGFPMIMMLLGSYYFDYNQLLGKSLWTAGLIIDAIHILIFTYRNVIKGVKFDTFVPSWFVTYNGILVSSVIGIPMKEPFICKIIAVYGIGVFTIIIPFMIWRLMKKSVDGPMLHTRAIVMAPSSLSLVSYLNFFENPNPTVVYLLYIAVFLSLVFIIYNLPKFFSVSFTPAFAGLTFPMAIGVVASGKMSGYLMNNGMGELGNAIKQIQGMQIYFTTAIIGMVLFNFFMMFRKSLKKYK